MKRENPNKINSCQSVAKPILFATGEGCGFVSTIQRNPFIFVLRGCYVPECSVGEKRSTLAGKPATLAEEEVRYGFVAESLCGSEH